jgi:hypothetical protein
MSETPYTVVEKQGGKIICCGKRPVLVQFTSLETIANVLNEEITPMIEALDEKNLEWMQAQERIAELEAALRDALDTAQNYQMHAEPTQQSKFKHIANICVKAMLAKADGNE